MSLPSGTWTLPLLLGTPLGIDLPPDFGGLGSIRAAGDANGDGTCDVLVADRDAEGIERVLILSGSDGSTLRELRGRTSGDCFGYTMACVGDVDGDGVPEIAVGARGGETVTELRSVPQDDERAYVRLFSGKDGRVLHEFDGHFVCSRAGDFDGDGKVDLLLSAGDRFTQRLPGGCVDVRSVAKSRWLLGLGPREDSRTARSFGASAGVLPDLDGDSIPEVVVCSPDRPMGRIVLVSGKLGHPIADASNDEHGNSMGSTLVVTSDLDGDRKHDLLVADPKLFVRALSGKDLRTLYTVASPAEGDGFATTLDAVPDVDGDGVIDFVVGCDESFAFDVGYARLYSGKTGAAIRSLFDSDREGVETCTLRDGRWEPTDRIALRVRTRRKLFDPEPTIDVLRIVSVRTGEVALEKALRPVGWSATPR